MSARKSDPAMAFRNRKAKEQPGLPGRPLPIRQHSPPSATPDRREPRPHLLFASCLTGPSPVFPPPRHPLLSAGFWDSLQPEDKDKSQSGLRRRQCFRVFQRPCGVKNTTSAKKRRNKKKRPGGCRSCFHLHN